MCNQRLLDSCPIQTYHQGQTKVSRTWVLRVELLEFFLMHECCLKFRLMGIDHREDKRRSFLRLRLRVNSRRVRLGLSRRYCCRIFCCTHRKIRRLVWFVLINGCLWGLRFFIWILLLTRWVRLRFQRCDVLNSKWYDTSIDVIAHEQIVGLRNFATDFEQLHQIMELTVDISADNDGSSDGNNIWLFC